MFTNTPPEFVIFRPQEKTGDFFAWNSPRKEEILPINLVCSETEDLFNVLVGLYRIYWGFNCFYIISYFSLKMMTHYRYIFYLNVSRHNKREENHFPFKKSEKHHSSLHFIMKKQAGTSQLALHRETVRESWLNHSSPSRGDSFLWLVAELRGISNVGRFCVLWLLWKWSRPPGKGSK